MIWMHRHYSNGPQVVRQARELRENKDWINWLENMLFAMIAVAAVLAGTLLAVAQVAGMI